MKKLYIGSQLEIDFDIRTWYAGFAWNDYHMCISIGPLGFLYYFEL